jgi:hypothetical protein
MTSSGTSKEETVITSPLREDNMKQPSRSNIAAVLCLLGIAAIATGCGSAQADPLEVTYYYLPG